jgi:hypothetical protein
VVLLGVAAIAGAAALVLTLRTVPLGGTTRELSTISFSSTDDG